LAPSSKAVLSSIFTKLTSGIYLDSRTKDKIKLFFNLAKKGKLDKDDVAYLHRINININEVVNFNKTSALAGQAGEDGIYLLDSSKLERTIDILKSLEHNGQPVIELAKAKEDLYWGREVGLAPDIVFRPKPGYEGIGLSSVIDETFKKPKNPYRGNHRPYGIILSPNLLRDEVKAWDVASSVYDFFELSKPDNLDGRNIY
jgi:hypothetical protein